MILFFALILLAVAIAGASALLIFWPLTLVHVRDRHPQVRDGFGDIAFLSGAAWWWLLDGRYRALGDRNLDGLATPARVSLITLLIALAGSGVLWLWSEAGL